MEKSFEDYLALRRRYNPTEMKGRIIVTQYMGHLKILGHQNSSGESINPSNAEGDVSAVCVPVGASIPRFIDSIVSDGDGTLRVDPATLQLYE